MQQNLSSIHFEMSFAHQDKKDVIVLLLATCRLPLTPWVKYHKTEVEEAFEKRIILKFEIDPSPQTRGIASVLPSSESVFLNFHDVVLLLDSAIYHLPFGFGWAMNHLETLRYTALGVELFDLEKPRSFLQLFIIGSFIRDNILLKGFSIKW